MDGRAKIQMDENLKVVNLNLQTLGNKIKNDQT